MCTGEDNMKMEKGFWIEPPNGSGMWEGSQVGASWVNPEVCSVCGRRQREGGKVSGQSHRTGPGCWRRKRDGGREFPVSACSSLDQSRTQDNKQVARGCHSNF